MYMYNNIYNINNEINIIFTFTSYLLMKDIFIAKRND